VIPYSFIVGWFVNSADIVGRWSPFASGDFEYGWYSQKETITDVLTMEPYSQYPTGGNSVVFETKPYIDQVNAKVTHNRVSVEALPKFPLTLNFDISPAQALDLVTLALQGFKRGDGLRL
jgi:hypothetical protein